METDTTNYQTRIQDPTNQQKKEGVHMKNKDTDTEETHKQLTAQLDSKYHYTVGWRYVAREPEPVLGQWWALTYSC